MYDLDTILGSKLGTSIRVGNVYILASEIELFCNQFCFSVMNYQHDPDYPVDLIGSGSGLFAFKRQLILCTKHQLIKRDAKIEGFCIHVPDTEFVVTSNGYHCFGKPNSNFGNESDRDDACFFDMTGASSTYDQLLKRFAKVPWGIQHIDNDCITAFFANGFAYSDQKFEYDPKIKLDTACRSIPCEERSFTLDTATATIMPYSEIQFDPNGLSGGPVFAIVRDRTDLTLRFAGVIARAGTKKITYIKAEVFHSLVQKTL